MNQAKGHKDEGLSANQNPRTLSGEGMAWTGARTVVLQKNSQGFGFTLRHFIVYPPEPTRHTNLQDEENCNIRGHRAHLEPMDTIFVKNVREKSPAHQAGLCTGDRLVRVNGESVLGKTYSQVIALIQNSENVLEMSIMPKDEAVLQPVNSEDAYLTGNEPYSGEAQNLPEPPPLHNQSSKPTRTSQNYSHHDNLNCKPNCSGIIRRCSEGADVPSSAAGTTVSPLDFHFANHSAAIASATLPHPRRGLSQAHSELCHQGLVVSHQHRSFSEDELSEMRLESSCGEWPHSVSQDTLLLHYNAAVGTNHLPRMDSQRLGRWDVSGGQTYRHSCSENLLAAYASYEHNYSRSLETLEKASALLSPHERTARPPQSNQPMTAEERPSPANHRAAISTTVPPAGRGLIQAQQQQTGSQRAARIRRSQTVDDQTVGYRSYSRLFCRKANHLMQQSHSFRDPSYTGPHLSWTTAPKTAPPDSAPSSGHESSSTAEPQHSTRADAGVGVCLEESVQPQIQKVVLRQKPPSSRKPPHDVRRSHCEPLTATAPASPVHQANGGKPPSPVEQDSMAAIPYIDEPISPSVDLCARHVPASSVVSSSLCQASVHTPSLLSPNLTSLLPTDCSNIKNSRRSSYLLAITTQRSKSCDGGLNSFREEGRVFSRLPKRVKSFFTEGSVESLRAAEETRSKRHSSSDLRSFTLTDVRKEGWLHYKQILTETGKKVGSGMRPWKRVFSVLRIHSLFLYKDKREAVLHAAGAGSHRSGQGEEEQPISIRGCLIDIAYSETKRKHTLRLMTQDSCEYLLQAEDRDDMLSWIRAVRENSRTDSEELCFSRQALINKKLNDYQKQSPAGSTSDTSPRIHRMIPPFLLSKTENTGLNRVPGKDENAPSKALWGISIMKKGKKGGPKAFGVRLEDCPPAASNKFVPQIVETCCGLVEEMGLEYTGIYRVPGNNAMVSSLQEQLDKGMEINTAEERWQDLNVISSLLKSFFRKLPESLFTDDKYSDFIHANRLEDAGHRLKTLRKLIRDLPEYHYHTLRFLIGHLNTVAAHSEKNKMESRNLALVFGPTLVRSSEDNMIHMVTHMPDRCKIIETLILHHMWFFSDELQKDEKTPEEQQDLQSVPNIDHLLSNIGRTLPQGDPSDSTHSDSVKCKETSTVKKDVRDFLPLSIISAVTWKRRKQQSSCPPDGSTDEDSEHEPIKSSSCPEAEEETEEGGVERGRKQVEEDERPCDEERERLKEVCDGEHTGQIRRPRSFLYSQRRKSELKASLQKNNSTCSTPSQTPNLTHSLPRGGRVRPHSLYVERSRMGEEQSSEAIPAPHIRPLGFSRVKASLIRLRQAVSPSRSGREASHPQGWMSREQTNILTPPDGSWGAGRERQSGSQETHRRSRNWRRHTVMVNMPVDR